MDDQADMRLMNKDLAKKALKDALRKSAQPVQVPLTLITQCANDFGGSEVFLMLCSILDEFQSEGAETEAEKCMDVLDCFYGFCLEPDLRCLLGDATAHDLWWKYSENREHRP